VPIASSQEEAAAKVLTEPVQSTSLVSLPVW
jgi:hypothetical protein